MPRIALAASIVFLMLASAASGQDNRGPLEQVGEIDAAEYIRGILANDPYNPQERERARNYQPEIEAGEHWRSSIFDGRRTRATRGTGLQLPDLNRDGQ